MDARMEWFAVLSQLFSQKKTGHKNYFICFSAPNDKLSSAPLFIDWTMLHGNVSECGKDLIN